MEKLLFIASILFLLTTASATSFTGIDAISDGLNDSQLQQLKQEYNNNTEDVPAAVNAVIGEQRANLRIEDQSYSLAMKGSKMARLETGELQDPTLEVTAEEEALENIMESENPRQEISRQLESDSLSYRAYGLFKRMKFSVLERFL